MYGHGVRRLIPYHRTESGPVTTNIASQYEAIAQYQIPASSEIESRQTMALLRRSMAAYIRSGGPGEPRFAFSGVWHVEVNNQGDQRTHVVLADERRLLAVYRVRGCGRLMRLRRWPATLDHNADPAKVAAFRNLCEWPGRPAETPASLVVARAPGRPVEVFCTTSPALMAASSTKPTGSKFDEDDLELTLAELDDI